jgi:hypothetical protein
MIPGLRRNVTPGFKNRMWPQVLKQNVSQVVLKDWEPLIEKVLPEHVLRIYI